MKDLEKSPKFSHIRAVLLYGNRTIEPCTAPPRNRRVFYKNLVGAKFHLINCLAGHLVADLRQNPLCLQKKNNYITLNLSIPSETRSQINIFHFPLFIKRAQLKNFQKRDPKTKILCFHFVFFCKLKTASIDQSWCNQRGVLHSSSPLIPF